MNIKLPRQNMSALVSANTIGPTDGPKPMSKRAAKRAAKLDARGFKPVDDVEFIGYVDVLEGAFIRTNTPIAKRTGKQALKQNSHYALMADGRVAFVEFSLDQYKVYDYLKDPLRQIDVQHFFDSSIAVFEDDKNNAKAQSLRETVDTHADATALMAVEAAHPPVSKEADKMPKATAQFMELYEGFASLTPQEKPAAITALRTAARRVSDIRNAAASAAHAWEQTKAKRLAKKTAGKTSPESIKKVDLPKGPSSKNKK